MLWLCRSCKTPTTHIATLASAFISTVLVTTIGSRCDFQKNIVILSLLQTVYVYLNGWIHAPVKDQTRFLLLLDNESYEIFSFQNLLKLKSLNVSEKTIIQYNNIIPLCRKYKIFHKKNSVAWTRK